MGHKWEAVEYFLFLPVSHILKRFQGCVISLSRYSHQVRPHAPTCGGFLLCFYSPHTVYSPFSNNTRAKWVDTSGRECASCTIHILHLSPLKLIYERCLWPCSFHIIDLLWASIGRDEGLMGIGFGHQGCSGVSKMHSIAIPIALIRYKLWKGYKPDLIFNLA